MVTWRKNLRVAAASLLTASAFLVATEPIAAGLSGSGIPKVSVATTLAVTNRTPMTDPRTSLPITNAGIVGDVLDLAAAGLVGAVTVRFSGAVAPVSATSTGVGTYRVTVPAGATTGIVTAEDSSSNSATSAVFQIWRSRSEPYVMPAGHLNITLEDLGFLLDQIKFAEAHADRTRTASAVLAPSPNAPSTSIRFPYDISSSSRCLSAADVAAANTLAYGPTYLSDIYTWTNLDPWGLRQVDGECNNITNVTQVSVPVTGYRRAVPPNDTSGWGAADQEFRRDEPSALLGSSPYVLSVAQQAYQSPTASVKDPTPRFISNLVSDQSTSNPAALAAATYSSSTLYAAPPSVVDAVNATTGAARSVYEIPNVTSDYNVSAGYNSWFTLFGQFFDHGLDLIPKGGSTVLIPLQQDDPLYVDSPTAPNFMILTRGVDADGGSINTTSPYVDQSQAYGSHPSQNFFVREYSFASGTGTPSSNGRLLESTDEQYTSLPARWLANLTVGGTLTHAVGDSERANGGVPLWRDIKAQARLLGFALTDYDARSVPVIATDQYGRFTPGPTGMPMMLFSDGTQYVWAWGSAASPIGTGARTSSNPGGGTSLPGQAGSGWVAVSSGHAFINDTMSTAVPFAQGGSPLTPDADAVMNSNRTTSDSYYDDEMLDAHLVAGDGRINENIALSAVHHVFHSEHNTVLADITSLLADHPLVSAEFRSEWNGERLYQAARLVNEMEYQHVAYDEFVRRIAPNLPVFLQYNPTINASISQEFASAIYRLGHSMLNERLARSKPGSFYDPSDNEDVSLVQGFTNPAQIRQYRPIVLASATKTGNSIEFELQTGERAPEPGAVLSVSGMDSDVMNVVNAVVDSATSTSFTVSTRYPGGSASSAVPLSSASGTVTSVSTVGLTDGANLARAQISDPGPAGYPWSPGTAAAATAQGMSSQRGNEVDEFVTDSVRNNLLGLPLDLAALNITRGRDTGLPTLNQFRARNASALPPYTSWNDFITNLRYPESGVNFVAAYGSHPSLTAPVVLSALTAASAAALDASTLEISYSAADTTGISVGGIVSIAGLTDYNVANAVVHSKDATSFTVRVSLPRSPLSVASFPSGSALRSDGAVAITGVVGSASPAGSGAQVTREPTIDERRASALVLTQATTGDAYEFMNSTGAWSSTETGINDIDLWLGGLAENPAKQPLTPPILGPTFQFVFQDQTLRLQDGDRFYYLGRLAGRNIGEEIPAQKLTDIVRRNTPSVGPDRSHASSSGIFGMNSPGFGVSDCAFATSPAFVPFGAACPAATMTTSGSGVLTHNGLDNVTGFTNPNASTGVRLAGGAGDDAIFGTRSNDFLTGGLSGGDLIDGYDGFDILIGGPGEDLIKGGAGDDVINAGESQAGDTTDGGSGSDYLHCGNCQGAAASFIGEAGDDFVQGGRGADLVLEGGEGNDWVEGLASGDFVFGDGGLVNIGAVLGGGNDVLWAGEGIDFASGDSGEDVLKAGDSGIDALDGGRGFDWVTYEHNVRFDTGAAPKPGVWLDLSGVNPNPLNNQGDAILGVEGVSGGPGADVLVGSLATDVTVPVAVGTAGSTTLVIPGAWTQIGDGMTVSGPGISQYAIVVGPAAVAIVGGVTTTTVDLSVPLLANVSGQVTFLSWQIRNPDLIGGLRPLLTGTPGWTKYTAVDPTAQKWSGGNVLLGGPGNDAFRVVGGAGLIHGGAMLHACIVATNNGVRFSTNSDTTCDGGPGYTGMSKLSQYLDSGVLRPAGLRIVRELQFLSATDAAAARDVLELPGLASDYVFSPIASLPAGVTSGWTMWGPEGLPTTIYDVALVKFGVAAAVPITQTRSTLASLTLNPGSIDPAFFPGQRFYTATVPATTASVTVTPTVTFGGAILTVNGAAVTSGMTSPAITLPTGTAILGPTRIPVVVTSPDRLQTNTYFIDVVRAGTVPVMSAPVVTATGCNTSVTNWSSAVTYQVVSSSGIASVGAVGGGKLPITLSGLTPGKAASVTVTASRLGYSTTTATVTCSVPVTAVLVPLFDVPVQTRDGFTVNVINYDPSFQFAASGSAGTLSTSAPTGSLIPLKVTGLSMGQSATITVLASRTGNPTGTGRVTSSALLNPALVPAFDPPTPSLTGFSSRVINYDPAFTWTVKSSRGTVTWGTASGSSRPFTVSGLTAGQTATVTMSTTRTMYYGGSATLTGTAYSGPALTPLLSAPTTTATGFSFTVTNYNSAWLYGATSTAGIVTLGTPSGTVLPVTVTGLAPTQPATVTINTTRTGYPVGSASATGVAPQAALVPSFATPVRGSTSFTVTIRNYSPLWTWTYKASAGKVTVGTPSGSNVTITVSGLTGGKLATLTVTTNRAGYFTGTGVVTS